MCFSVDDSLKCFQASHFQGIVLKPHMASTTAACNNKGSGRAIFSLHILGCSSRSGVVERKLRKMTGIRNVKVDYVTDTVLVSYDPTKLTAGRIREFLRNLPA